MKIWFKSTASILDSIVEVCIVLTVYLAEYSLPVQQEGEVLVELRIQTLRHDLSCELGNVYCKIVAEKIFIFVKSGTIRETLDSRGHYSIAEQFKKCEKSEQYIQVILKRDWFQIKKNFLV